MTKQISKFSELMNPLNTGKKGTINLFAQQQPIEDAHSRNINYFETNRVKQNTPRYVDYQLFVLLPHSSKRQYFQTYETSCVETPTHP